MTKNAILTYFILLYIPDYLPKEIFKTWNIIEVAIFLTISAMFRFLALLFIVKLNIYTLISYWIRKLNKFLKVSLVLSKWQCGVTRYFRLFMINRNENNYIIKKIRKYSHCSNHRCIIMRQRSKEEVKKVELKKNKRTTT